MVIETRLNMLKIIKNNVIYFIIIMIQIVGILYWTNEKSNYYVDELYSLGYASSFTGVGDTARYIPLSDDWKFNNWTSNSDLKKYLTVSDDEKVTSLPFQMAVEKLLFSRSYFGWLNIAESLLGYTVITIRPGVVLNIMFLVITELVMVIFYSKMHIDKLIRYLSLGIFGLCGYVAGLAIYIRFYMYIVMLSMIMVLLHYFIWNNKSIRNIVLCELISAILAYLIYMNSELAIVYVGAMFVCFDIAFFICKKWKAFVSYSFMLFAGVVYLCKKTQWIDVLINTDNYSNDGILGMYSQHFANATFQSIKQGFLSQVKLLQYYYFDHFYIFILWVILLFILLCAAVKNRFIFDKQKVYKDSGFIITLMIVLISYSSFIAMAGMSEGRYYCFGFATFAIIFWYLVDRLVKQINDDKARNMTCFFMMALVIMSCFAPFQTRNIEYVYEQDRELSVVVNRYEELYTVIVPEIYDDGTISNPEVYDCIIHLADDACIYPINYRDYSYNNADFKAEFLLWNMASNKNVEEIISDLEDNGYSVEHIAENHVSSVYLCKLL